MKNDLIWLSLASLPLAVSGTALGSSDSLEPATSTAAAFLQSTQTAIDAAAHAASAAAPALVSIGTPSVERLPSVQAAIEAADPVDLKDSRLALTVVGPFGARYHLAYTAGQGWQFVDLPSPSAILRVNSDGTFAPQVALTSSEIHPQTVFIDGPTGYTFVWDAQGGWKFVGNIATAER